MLNKWDIELAVAMAIKLGGKIVFSQKELEEMELGDKTIIVSNGPMSCHTTIEVVSSAEAKAREK